MDESTIAAGAAAVEDAVMLRISTHRGGVGHRRRPAGVAALSTLGLLALLLGAVPGAGARPARTVAATVASSPALQVTQIEYRLTLSRGSVSAGRLSLQAIDRGRDPHDLRLRSLSSGRRFAAPQLTPGERWNGVVYL